MASTHPAAVVIKVKTESERFPDLRSGFFAGGERGLRQNQSDGADGIRKWQALNCQRRLLNMFFGAVFSWKVD